MPTCYSTCKIWMDNLYCKGDEASLDSCRFDGWGSHDCAATEAAGVICEPKVEPQAESLVAKDEMAKPKLKLHKNKNIEVQLRGGRYPFEGRVEVRFGKRDWGLVCGDGWSLLEANVVCQQLGLGYGSAAVQSSYFGGHHDNIVISGVKCTGRESNLTECLYETLGRVSKVSCPGREENIAGVVCAKELPDLVPDEQEVERSAYLEDRQLLYLQCAMEENCLASEAYKLDKNDYGWLYEQRRLLRFTARIGNIGTTDFRPFLPKQAWQWHMCHLHYHSMEVFAHFDIIDRQGQKVAEGHKASFCLEDNNCRPGVEKRYACANYGDQGISVGCTDTYLHNIDCQWIDITDLAPGIYNFKHSGPSSIAMMTTWVCVLLALQFAGHVRPASAFRAAVFEHAEQSHALPSDSPEDIVLSNLEYYSRAVQFARLKDVEVIVFPEYGIFPPIGDRKRLKRFLEHVPDPREVSSNPCQEPDSFKDRPILYTLSCLARGNRMVIVANMGDIQPCRRERGCPEDGDLCFNTNVAFDRDGRILAKYHKEHLFNETGMDVPAPGQDPTFECHLGRFATFVCFDIVFQRMAEVGRWEGIRAVLFPTMWLNSGPLFNSLQYFEAWAVGNNVSLLAANVHQPGYSGLGSVIVKGREGARVYTFNPDGNSKLLLADLEWRQCSPEPESSIYVVSEEGVREWRDDGRDVGTECSSKVLKPAKDIYKDYRCLERDTSDFSLTRLETPSGRLESCHGGLCCTLEYAADELRGDFYLGVFNGTYNSIDRYFFAEEDCFLARCDGLGDKSCVTFPTRSETLFRQVRMRANFSTDFVYPSVVESGMRLTPTSQWTFETAEKSATLSLNDISGNYLLVLGLKARPYPRDPPYVK